MNFGWDTNNRSGNKSFLLVTMTMWNYLEILSDSVLFESSTTMLSQKGKDGLSATLFTRFSLKGFQVDRLEPLKRWKSWFVPKLILRQISLQSFNFSSHVFPVKLPRPIHTEPITWSSAHFSSIYLPHNGSLSSYVLRHLFPLALRFPPGQRLFLIHLFIPLSWNGACLHPRSNNYQLWALSKWLILSVPWLPQLQTQNNTSSFPRELWWN